MVYLIVIVFVLGFYFGRRNSSQIISKYYDLKRKIELESQTTTNKQVKEVLAKILGVSESTASISEQESKPIQASASIDLAATAPQKQNNQSDYQSLAVTSSVNIAETSEPRSDFAIKNYIDNTSLLLYFGAFLFITSVGLFVAFGDVEGFMLDLLCQT